MQTGFRALWASFREQRHWVLAPEWELYPPATRPLVYAHIFLIVAQLTAFCQAGDHTRCRPNLQMEARFGEHNNRFAVALRHCMTIGDPEIIGCVATLGTIRHEDLNRLLSTLYGGSMQILIVESRAVSTRLEKRLREKVRQPQSMLFGKQQCSY